MIAAMNDRPDGPRQAAPIVTSQLVRQILLGGARSGLDVAGTVLVGPAWPVLRGALGPVLDRLTEKLGGADPLASETSAEQAAAAFEQDPRLEELLRSNLTEALAPVREGQERLEAGFVTLHAIVNETNADIRRLIEDGVTLDKEAEERLVDATAARLETMLEVRGFLQRDAGVPAGAAPPAWVTREQLVSASDAAIAQANEAEVAAVGAIRRGEVAEATATLEGQRATLALALAETPTDTRLRVQYGYILKALGQAATAAGDVEGATDWLTRAETIFRLALRDAATSALERETRASAANGLGSVLAVRGLHDQAIAFYADALELEPTYGYAWHDLLASLLALAGQGDVRDDALDAAWSGLVASAAGYPGLDDAYLEQLRIHCEHVRTG
jgi:tetratricopeptide (TPR) repeat protein